MIALKPRKEIIIRILLITVVLLNGLGANPATASSISAVNTPKQESPSKILSNSLSNSSVADQQDSFNRMPLSFAANVGQFDKAVQFQTSTLGGSIYFTPSEVVLALMDKKESKVKEDDSTLTSAPGDSKVARIQYNNAEKNPAVEGLDLQPGVANFMVGSDKKAWVSNASTYGGVLYRGLYVGVDLKYEGAEGNLKSTFNGNIRILRM